MASEKDQGPMIGQRFGKEGCYLLQKKLGHGGMGEVYLARDERKDRPVAIKFLRKSTADRITVERFNREGTRYSVVCTHSNIVQILAFGKQRGLLFIVSEFVDGRTLAQLLDSNGAFAVEEAIRVAREIACGLLPAHRAHAVHRDLKPANVMIRSSDRVVKILDFGIAKDLASTVGLTRTKEYVGTPGYSAPEQILGREIDHRADIFSLGVILYELLTGKLAFQGRKTNDVLDATRHHDPIPPTELNENVTKPVAALIARMIQKSRRRRPADMAEVIAEIDRVREVLLRGFDEEEKRGVRSWLRKLFEG